MIIPLSLIGLLAIVSVVLLASPYPFLAPGAVIGLAGVLVPLWLLDWWTLPSRDDSLLWVLQQAASGFLQLFALVVLFRLFMLLDRRQAQRQNSD